MEKHKHDTPEQREKFAESLKKRRGYKNVPFDEHGPNRLRDNGDWNTWLHCCEANENTVAELVSLLRMGKELAEAARDSTQGTPEKRYRASNEANAILERYDAAIAEYGGA